MSKFFKPLKYRQYLLAMLGLWLIAFALGSRFGAAIKPLALPFVIGGLIIHGLGMHPAHKQPHKP